MQINKEANFVLKGNKVLHPPVRTDGLELYYDTKGKKNTDTYKNKLLDMSGNDRHGELHNFDYKNLSGYQEDSQLVFDGIDDTLKIPKLNGIDVNNFTYQLNNNILAFTGGEVRTVKNGAVKIVGRNLLKGTSDSFKEINPRTRFTSLPENSITPISEYGLKTGDTITFRTYIQTHNSVPVNAIIVPHFVGGGYGFTTGNRIQAGEEGYSTVTYTIPSNVDRLEVGLDAPVPAGNTSILMYYKEAKLEKGSTATDWMPAPEDLIETTDLKGNILGDMEDTIDDHTRDEQSGLEVFTDKADDSLVRVEVDGKSYQHAGSGKNLIPLQGWDLRGDAYVDEDSGYIYSSFSSFAYSPYVKIKPNTDYTYSHYGSPHRASLRFLDINKDTIASYTSWDGVGTLSSPDNAYYFRRYGTDTSLQTELEGFKFQLEEGSTATEYELPAPSPDYPIEIHSLNDFDVVSSKVGRNYFSVSFFESVEGISNPFYSDEIDYVYTLEPDTYYTLSTTEPPRDSSGKAYIHFGNFPLKANSRLNGVAHGSPKTILTNNEGKVSITINRFYTQETISRIINGDYKIHLEKGTTATDWTPAPEDITENDNHPLTDKVNLSLSEPLRSIGDVKDRLFRDSDGLWKIERNVGEEVFENGEKFSDSYWYERDDSVVYGITSKASHMKEHGAINLSHFPEGEMNATEANVGWLQTIPRLRIRVGHEVIGATGPSVPLFKEWLVNEYNKGTPLTIVYEKAEPTTETLDQELQDKLNNLRSFQGSNYVYTIINDKTDTLPSHISENLKPTIHTEFLAKDHYKENRTVNNLLIWNRSLEDEELLSQNKLFHERFNMRSNVAKGEPINQEINLLNGGYVGNALSLDYTLEI